MQKITPCLWFDGQGEEAAKLYVSLFKDSKITATSPGLDGKAMTVAFTLDGNNFLALNGGPQFKFTEAISMSVDCADQAEVDHFWTKLTADGGEESMCGWLKDKYGVSWQIVPRQLIEMISHSDREKAGRAMQAMLQMRKIDIATMKAAFDSK